MCDGLQTLHRRERKRREREKREREGERLAVRYGAKRNRFQIERLTVQFTSMTLSSLPLSTRGRFDSSVTFLQSFFFLNRCRFFLNGYTISLWAVFEKERE